MLSRFLEKLDSAVEFETVDAHCDIPCKIYDPSTAIIAALSVVRLIDIANEAAAGEASLKTQNTIARCVMRKEEEAEKVKHEIRVIWGDYIKAPQVESHPEVNDLAHDILLKGSACKQGIERSDAEELVELVNKFAEIFWATKGVETVRKTCPYPPSIDVVYPVL